MIFNGIYEQVINQAIDSGLQQIDRNENLVDIADIDAAEAQHILSDYIAKVVEQGLFYIRDEYKEQSKSIQIAACNEIIKKLSELTKSDDILEWKIGDKGQQLFAVVKKTEQKIKDNRPVTSLSISTLFTGSKLEPSMVSELKKEIATADRIDMLVSFIKWSGLRLIFDELKEFTLNHKLRIITTSYMGATDVKALAELASLPNTSIKISYNTKRTRLHAKAYMFYRNTGYSTAYIGSSNLSSAAIGDGLEWNIKATNQDMPHIIRNIDTTWNKTTGAGANVDDWNTFNQINWEINGRPATEAEKRATFDYFDKITSKGKQNVDEKGKLLEKNNNKADFYSNKSQLKISSNETDRLLRNHITEDILYRLVNVV